MISSRSIHIFKKYKLLFRLLFVAIFSVIIISCSKEEDLADAIGLITVEDNVSAPEERQNSIIYSQFAFTPTDDIYLSGKQGLNDTIIILEQQ